MSKIPGKGEELLDGEVKFIQSHKLSGLHIALTPSIRRKAVLYPRDKCYEGKQIDQNIKIIASFGTKVKLIGE